MNVSFLQNQGFSTIMGVSLGVIVLDDVTVCKGLLLAGNNMGYRCRMLSFAYPSSGGGFRDETGFSFNLPFDTILKSIEPGQAEMLQG